MSHATAHALTPGRGQVAVRVGVIAYIGLLVALPLAALTHEGLGGGLAGLWSAISAPQARAALALTLVTSAAVAVVNAFAGTLTAWVLVRYPLPGKRILSALVDLPFAIPTLVAGIMLVLLFGPQRLVGSWLVAHDVQVLYARPAIVLALLFITVPFVVRAVEPVLREIDPAEEEAALTLGARPHTTFVRVVLPALLPSIGYGTLQSFARSLAEFGSIVVVAGNIPFRTLTAPVYIFGEVESGAPDIAAAVSLVLLLIALVLSALTRLLGRSRMVKHV